MADLKEGRGRGTKRKLEGSVPGGKRTRGELKFNRAFYTKWSKWTQCTPMCKTVRSRECKFSMVCGQNKVHEEAYCYTSGSRCETWYKEGNTLVQLFDVKSHSHKK